MMHLREEDVPEKALKNAQKAKIQKQVLRKPELAEERQVIGGSISVKVSVDLTFSKPRISLETICLT
jgi:hypothetical protein